jgi:hypothetical protein
MRRERDGAPQRGEKRAEASLPAGRQAPPLRKPVRVGATGAAFRHPLRLARSSGFVALDRASAKRPHLRSLFCFEDLADAHGTARLFYSAVFCFGGRRGGAALCSRIFRETGRSSSRCSRR